MTASKTSGRFYNGLLRALMGLHSPLWFSKPQPSLNDGALAPAVTPAVAKATTKGRQRTILCAP